MVAPATAAILLAVAGLSVAACDDLFGGEAITGSGDLTTESYDFTDFTELEVSSAFDVEVAKGDDYVVEVTVDDNVVDKLDVKLSGSSRLDGTGLQADEATFDISGASRVAMTGSAESADIKLAGASRADLGGFAVGDVEVRTAGSGDAVVNTGGTITGDLSGSSKLTYLGEPTPGELKTSRGSTVERG